MVADLSGEHEARLHEAQRGESVMAIEDNNEPDLDRSIADERDMWDGLITRAQAEMELDRFAATFLIWYADSIVSERLNLPGLVEGAIWYESLALRSTPGPFYDNVPEDHVAEKFYGFQQFVEHGARIGTVPPLTVQDRQEIIEGIRRSRTTLLTTPRDVAVVRNHSFEVHHCRKLKRLLQCDLDPRRPRQWQLLVERHGEGYVDVGASIIALDEFEAAGEVARGLLQHGEPIAPATTVHPQHYLICLVEANGSLSGSCRPTECGFFAHHYLVMVDTDGSTSGLSPEDLPAFAPVLLECGYVQLRRDGSFEFLEHEEHLQQFKDSGLLAQLEELDSPPDSEVPPLLH